MKTRYALPLLVSGIAVLLLTCAPPGRSAPEALPPAASPSAAPSVETAPPQAPSAAAPSPAPRGSPLAAADKWALWSNGTRLRGANVYQRLVYPALDQGFLGSGPLGPPFTQADFDRLAALGANYVNLSHPGLFTETPPYQVDLNVQANLDALIAMAAQANLYVVITARTGPGRSEFWAYWGEDTTRDPEGGWFPDSYYNNRLWGDQAAQDAWVAMWQYTAQRYKDNPVVIGYDLMCEPNSNDVGSYPLGQALEDWDPEHFYATYGGTLYDWNQLYPRISAAIRQVDSKTPILIGGNGYSGAAWLPYMQPTGDSRTVYTIHQYEPYTYTHQISVTANITYPGVFDADWDGIPDTVDRAWLDTLLADTVDAFRAAHGSPPVAANEYGVHRWAPGAEVFMSDLTALFEQRGMNYALWEWSTSWEPFASGVHAFTFGFGPDPANRTNVPNPLQDVILSWWARNTARPSGAALFLPLVARR